MIALLISLLLTQVSTQATATFDPTTSLSVVLTSSSTSVDVPTSPSNPDVYRNFQIGIQNIYTLSSNNFVEIRSKAYPNTLIQNYTEHNYSSPPAYDFMYISVNVEETLMVLTSHKAGSLQFLIYSIGSSGTVAFANETLPNLLDTPYKTFIKGEYIYCYIWGITNDIIYRVSVWDHTIFQ